MNERNAVSQPKGAEEEEGAGYGDVDLMGQLRSVSSTLLGIAGIPPRKIQEEERFLQASHETGEIETTIRGYPLYKQSQVAYAVTGALNETEDPLFCKYSGQFRRSADFIEVQITREERVRCLVSGFCYFRYTMPEPEEEGPHDPTSIPLILKASLTGWCSELTVLSRVDHLQAAAAFLEEIDRVLAEKNYLIGEKLELRGQGQLKFFEYEDLGWDDIILSDDVRSEIGRQLVYPISHREVYRKLGLPWKRGLLLHGIPGTGKTLLGKIICHLAPCTFIWVTVKALSDIDDVRKLYEAARELAPTVVFWEDIDLIGENRKSGYFSPILGELLNQLDGISPLDGVFTVATTNYIEHLDYALSRRPARFDVRLHLDLPSTEQRKRMYKIFLEGFPASEEIDCDALAKASAGMSGAAINDVVIRAVQYSLEDGDEGSISQKHLLRGVDRVKFYGQKILGFLPASKREEEGE